MPPDFSLLNKQQQQIVQLLSTGLSNKEIANQLGINRRTMDDYITKIYRKLNLYNKDGKGKRTLLAVAYIEHEYVSRLQKQFFDYVPMKKC
jgi:DNA-binding NarL/FixJ family response regulator